MKPDGYRATLRKEFSRAVTWRDVVVEFVGTFFLVSVQCALPLSWGSSTTGTVAHTGLGMSFVVVGLVWALGDMGGAHMNPAVTLAMALTLKVTVTRALVYVALQCAGGVAGAAFVYSVTPPSRRETLAATVLQDEMAPWQGVLVELWLTCFFILVILGSTNSRRKDNLFMHSLPIGLAVGVCVMSGAKSTGASINPARSLGPAVMMKLWKHHWIYWVGPLAGSALAVIVYQVIFDAVDRKASQNNRAPTDKENEASADSRL